MDILLDPNLVYLVLVVGFIMAVMAVLSPGTGIFEIIALFAFIYVGWAVYNLPAVLNIWVLGGMLVLLAPLAFAVRKTGQRIYLALAILVLVLGTFFLFSGASWLPAVNPLFALGVSVLMAGFLWIVGTKMLDLFKTTPTHDLSRLIGAVGEAKTDILSEGSVQLYGELWTAQSKELIPIGTRVRVVGREGFILDVEPVEGPLRGEPEILPVDHSQEE